MKPFFYLIGILAITVLVIAVWHDPAPAETDDLEQAPQPEGGEYPVRAAETEEAPVAATAVAERRVYAQPVQDIRPSQAGMVFFEMIGGEALEEAETMRPSHARQAASAHVLDLSDYDAAASVSRPQN